MRLPRLLLSAGVFALTPAAFAQVKDVLTPAAKPADPKKAEDKKGNKSVDPVELDKKALEAAGLKPDDLAGLTAYLKSRTLNDADMSKIQGLIKKMNGEAKFDDRLAAEEELIAIGGQAVAPLRLVAKDDKADPEIVYRAKNCLRRMEKEKALGTDVTLAVVRSLGRTKAPEVPATLLGFLPLADSTVLIEAIQASLRDTAAGPDGKASKVLTDALADANPVRRRVAALALIEGGTADHRIRFEDLHPKLVGMMKADKDAGVRFALARALLADAREKEAVAVLIDLMPEMTRGQSWQAEELLVQVGGKDAPKERCKHAHDRNGSDKELSSNKGQREKTSKAWKAWWDGAKDKTDLAKIDLRQTLRGHFLMASSGWSGNGQSALIFEYGADDKERNRLSFPVNNQLMDFAVTDAGTLFTLEYGMNVVNVRDMTGKVTTTWTVPQDANAKRFGFQPKGLQVRENGHLLVVHAFGVAEFDKDGKEAFKYTRPEVNKNPQMDVIGAVRMRNGNLVLNLNTNKLLTLDEKGKEVEGHKPVQTGGMNQNQKSLIQQTGDDKVILAEQMSVVEYDLKTGKADGVKLQNVYATSLQKLPNGNVLYATNNEYPQRVIEKTASGEEVWSMSTRDQNHQMVKGMVR